MEPFGAGTMCAAVKKRHMCTRCPLPQFDEEHHDAEDHEKRRREEK